MLNKISSFRVNYSVQDFCQDVLRKRFPGDPIRQEINDSDGDKLNFACPYCGDSLTDSAKKRGNLYLKTQTYKCYNDGCSIWVPLEKFVSNFARKYELEVPQAEERKIEFKPGVSSKKKGFLIEFMINRAVGQKLLKFDEVVARFSLKACKDADPTSAIGQFIEKRRINNLPVFEQSCYYDSRQDKVYLFNLDIKSGRVIGLAIRKINDDGFGPKYNIKGYKDFKKSGLVPDLEESFIQEVDSLNNYFNILNLDFTKEVTITEGQIDAMFIRNCVATTGVTKSKQLLESLVTKKNTRIFFDNDSAGKKASLDLLNKGYRVFLWAKVLLDLRKQYSNSSAQISSIKDINDLYRFMLAMDADLNYEKFNLFLDNYFSDSQFDIILL